MTEQEAYKATKEHLNQLLSGGGIPNIKAFDKTTKNLKKRMKLVEAGSQIFAQTKEQVEEAAQHLAELKGKYKAFSEVTKELKNKIKETCKD